MYTLGLFTLSIAVCTVAAKTIVITVGGNTTNDPTAVFKPNVITANQGDIVMFNFTNGNHTVTQSTFASPCVPAHITDSTVNGFDSSFRDAGKEQAITTLPVTIDDPKKTIWFYDYNTCAQGGVGAINLNKTSTETIDGFQRNAVRLNGTVSSSTSTSPASQTGTATGSSASSTTTSGAIRTTAQGTIVSLFTLVALAVFA